MKTTIQISELTNINADPHRLQIRNGLNTAALDHYTQLVKDGIDLQEITVFDTGPEKLVADGFHRVAAYRRAGRKSIPAELRQGTVADAQWYALAVNLKHGVPLTRDEREQAIRRALEIHPEQSNRAIAEYLGFSHPTVAKYRRDMESTGKLSSSKTRTGLDGKVRPAARPVPEVPSDDPPPDAWEPMPPPADHGLGKPNLDAAVPVDDLPPSIDDDAPPEVVDETPRDKLDNPITRPDAAETFRRSADVAAIISVLTKAKSDVLAMVAADDSLMAYVTGTAFETDLDNARRHLSRGMPYAICPYCGGGGCKTCKELGWVNKELWGMSPEDMRAALRPTEGGE